MVRTPALLLILASFGHNANAQQGNYWGHLAKGGYEVGFQDTVLLNRDQDYALGGYKGPKPYFVSIWFPLEAKSGRQIEYRDYLQLTSPRGLESVTDSIGKVQMAQFLKWGVASNQDLWESEPMTNSKTALAHKMLSQQLNVSRTSKYPTSRYPTIIYHHGNGGISFENAVLFEFLASWGLVTISCDYHWPGLRETPYTHESDLPLADVEFIVGFSSSLPFTDPNNRTYIGHSWGGSIALRLNQKGYSGFKKYLIFDSTIEQAGFEEFRVLNPYLDSLFRNHPGDFKTKTIDISSRGRYYENGNKNKPYVQPYPEFIPFQLIDNGAFTFVNLKQILNHGSYTSIGVMRSVFSKEFPQDDALTVNEQFETYQFLVELTRDILTDRELKKDQLLIIQKP